MPWYNERTQQQDAFVDPFGEHEPESWTVSYKRPSTRKPGENTYGCEVKGRDGDPVVQVRAFILDHTVQPPEILAEETHQFEAGQGMFGDYGELTRQAVYNLVIQSGSH